MQLENRKNKVIKNLESKLIKKKREIIVEEGCKKGKESIKKQDKKIKIINLANKMTLKSLKSHKT